MSYYRPIFADSGESFLKLANDAINSDFVVGPYNFNRTEILRDHNKGLTFMIFDLPADMVVFMNEVPLPGNIFDYFNPLLINARILDKLEFIIPENIQPLEQFKCYCCISKNLKNLQRLILDSLVYYPPSYQINYSTITAERSSQGKQIHEILNIRPIDQPIRLPTIGMSGLRPPMMDLLASVISRMQPGQMMPILSESQDSTDNDESINTHTFIIPEALAPLLGLAFNSRETSAEDDQEY